MTHSPLATGTVPHHGKYGSRDGRSITRVIQHHWAGPGGDARLANPTQQASSSYLVFSDGTIKVQVPEEFRPWTSGSYEADASAITIEVENISYQKHGDDNHPDSWAISDAAYRSIIALLADVARRYGWGSITNDRYRGHREFSPTACPGGYLWARMADIRAQANAVLSGGGITTVGTIEEDLFMALSDAEQRRILAAADRINGTIPDRRHKDGRPVTVSMEDTALSKADGAYQNGIAMDQVRALGRIETSLGTKPNKEDFASLQQAIQETSKGDPAALAAAVIAAVGKDLAGEVVAELGAALNKGGTK